MVGSRTLFETRPCPRCAGSGRFSYCQNWGTTCFKCGVKPGEPGVGVVLTKRGAAAYLYYESLLPTKLARDLQPGDFVTERGWRRRVIGAPQPTTNAFVRNGVEVRAGYLDIPCEQVTHSLVPEDMVLHVAVTRERKAELLAQALDYQSTLTKTGTVRKRRIA
jgi:hypothetical protein